MNAVPAKASPAPSRKRTRFTDPLLLRLSDAAAVAGLSQSGLRAEIRAGRLEARRSGRAVLVPVAELRRWADNLPSTAA